jgi:hypothetical protein
MRWVLLTEGNWSRHQVWALRSHFGSWFPLKLSNADKNDHCLGSWSTRGLSLPEGPTWRQIILRALFVCKAGFQTGYRSGECMSLRGWMTLRCSGFGRLIWSQLCMGKNLRRLHDSWDKLNQVFPEPPAVYKNLSLLNWGSHLNKTLLLVFLFHLFAVSFVEEKSQSMIKD